ncbi:MAG: GAF domain-containing protein [Lachnospiraceae bacterium]|nr:GAF domain-containing protein [Lachnospiraceae bacterium]
MVDYKNLEKQIQTLTKEENHYLPTLSNAVSLLMHALPGVNWIGVYLADDKGLFLGPFQGKPCLPRLPAGKGVCGVAMKKNDSVYVPNVHDHADYVSHDPTTDSEFVIPLRFNKKVIGVFIIDSPIINRFSVSDRDDLRRFVLAVERSADFSDLLKEDTVAPAAVTPPLKSHSMPFELWLYAIKGLAQTYEMVEPIYSQLSEQEKKALRDEYEKTD